MKINDKYDNRISFLLIIKAQENIRSNNISLLIAHRLQWVRSSPLYQACLVSNGSNELPNVTTAHEPIELDQAQGYLIFCQVNSTITHNQALM